MITTIQKRISLLLSALCFCFFADKVQAIPAKPTPITITQANGKNVSILLKGDEKFHYKTTLDGYVIQERENGNYYYMDISTDNNLEVSEFAVCNINERSENDNEFLQSVNTNEILSVLKQNAKKSLRSSSEPSLNLRLGNFPATGEQKSLVILVEFNDNSFQGPNANKAFSDLLNKEGYSENQATGSARDYFIDNSGGLFKPQFDVYGPVKLSNNINYYGGDDQNGNDLAPRDMVSEACAILAGEIDYSEYDNDGDGKVDNIYIFYAGYSESDGGSTETIWPHSWNLDDFNIIYNGVQLNTYACSSELINGVGTTMCGIGAFIHEFCHVLGLPDLYETNYNKIGAFTPGAWSVLDFGPYNNEQRTPPYMSAYERQFLGWLNLTELSAPANISIPSVDNNIGYIIKTNSANEYYILENRQQKGMDTYVPGHGMLVWHIDFDSDIWANNEVNNDPLHQRIDIEEADGTQSVGSRDGDSYPGTSNNTSFTDTTNPNMKMWDGTLLNKPITEITEHNGMIYFRFMGGKDLTGTVNALAATEITQTSFVANWEIKEDAASYLIDVYFENEEQTIEYIYQNENVGNRLSYKVENIEPGIIYTYTIRATDLFSTTSYSAEITVPTLAPTFEFYTPIAQNAESVTSDSFIANWSALNEATSYILNVYKKSYGTPTGNASIDFTGTTPTIPADWTKNSTASYKTDGYYGNASPSLRLDNDAQYIESPLYNDDISALSFWYRGVSMSEANSIDVYGYRNNKWQLIHKVQPILNVAGGTIETLSRNSLDGCKAISIRYNKSATGNVALDDIALEYGSSTTIEYVSGYQSLNVDNVLLYNVTGLDQDQLYFYTVTASNGSILSRPSNEIEVEVKSGSGISTDKSSFVIITSKESIVIKTDDSSPVSLAIFNTIGQKVYTSHFINETIISKNYLTTGIYILKLKEKTYKLFID